MAAKTDTKMTNGQRIRVLREMLGLSRPKFAAAVGINVTTLKNYELNYRELAVDPAVKIARCFRDHNSVAPYLTNSVALYLIGMHDAFIEAQDSAKLNAAFTPIKGK